MTYNQLKTLIFYMHSTGINSFSEFINIAHEANVKTNDNLLLFAEKLYNDKRAEVIFN